MPKAGAWRIRRQAKIVLKKKRKENEAGEEREGDNDEDADSEDGDGTGMGMGMGKTNRLSQRQVRVQRGPTRMRVWGWRLLGWRVKGWRVTGRWWARARGGKFRGAPADHTRGVAQGRTKRLTPCALAGTDLSYSVLSCEKHLHSKTNFAGTPLEHRRNKLPEHHRNKQATQ